MRRAASAAGGRRVGSPGWSLAAVGARTGHGEVSVSAALEGRRAPRDRPPWRCYGPMLTHSRSDGDFPVYTRPERADTDDLPRSPSSDMRRRRPIDDDTKSDSGILNGDEESRKYTSHRCDVTIRHSATCAI
ncbi:unnamed protein product [Plutella xylostella]|uniref:(diamondback moth) hypothetical protein n=1 Tax=Plutella xylostella TaxID=51655 RepID=A0A8S4DGE9_PLUXY|nr:unnamed protein product [Plutella xylostella]